MALEPFNGSENISKQQWVETTISHNISKPGLQLSEEKKIMVTVGTEGEQVRKEVVKRAIGDTTITNIRVLENGKVIEHSVESNLSKEETSKFLEIWEDNWDPLLSTASYDTILEASLPSGRHVAIEHFTHESEAGSNNEGLTDSEPEESGCTIG
jgi:hypothetical protein